MPHNVLIKVVQMVDGCVHFIVLLRHDIPFIQANIHYECWDEIARFWMKSRIGKLSEMLKFLQNAKLKCREIWPFQIHEINVSQKFHEIR